MADNVQLTNGQLRDERDRLISLSAMLTTTPVAFTQTYSTAAATVPAATATAVATTGATQVTPYGFTTAEQSDALVAAVNALIADVLAIRKTQNQIIDLLQSLGAAT